MSSTGHPPVQVRLGSLVSGTKFRYDTKTICRTFGVITFMDADKDIMYVWWANLNRHLTYAFGDRLFRVEVY